MIKAVIFDMDGLMIDSERVTYEGYVKGMRETGICDGGGLLQRGSGPYCAGSI